MTGSDAKVPALPKTPAQMQPVFTPHGTWVYIPTMTNGKVQPAPSGTVPKGTWKYVSRQTQTSTDNKGGTIDAATGKTITTTTTSTTGKAVVTSTTRIATPPADKNWVSSKAGLTVRLLSCSTSADGKSNVLSWQSEGTGTHQVKFMLDTYVQQVAVTGKYSGNYTVASKGAPACSVQVM